LLLLACIFSMRAPEARAQEAELSPEQAEELAAMQAFQESLNYQSGEVSIAGAGAKLSLSENFRYLDAADTKRLLEEAWGNPPGAEVSGAIVPAGFHPFAENWAVIVSFEDDGYVKDEDADQIDYAEILSQLQADAAEDSRLRVESGYEAIEVVGWAEPPHYDSVAHKIYWAKELKFGEAETNTLNYNIRALGRRGVLVLNAVGSMDQLSEVSAGMQSILPLVEFEGGSRYADFDPSVDKVAAYGIGALVAGKLAAKAGLLAKFAPLLLVFKKFGVFIVAGIAGLGRALWGRRKQPDETTPDSIG